MVDLMVLVVILTLIHLVDSLSLLCSKGGGVVLIPWRLHAVLFCLSLAFKKG